MKMDSNWLINCVSPVLDSTHFLSLSPILDGFSVSSAFWDRLCVGHTCDLWTFHLNVVGVQPNTRLWCAVCIPQWWYVTKVTHILTRQQQRPHIQPSKWPDSLCSLAVWAEYILFGCLKRRDRSKWPRAAAAVLFQGFMFPSLSQMLTSS